MTISPAKRPVSILSKRRVGWAAVAAVLGCAACCALPMLATAGLGGGAVALLSRVLRPGSELVVGGTVFAVALAVMAVRNRLKRAAGCGSSCALDGSCCDHGPARSA
jgi:mercuric ion transport protein